MPTKKQLAALAKGRAKRAANIKKKATKANYKKKNCKTTKRKTNGFGDILRRFQDKKEEISKEDNTPISQQITKPPPPEIAGQENIPIEETPGKSLNLPSMRDLIDTAGNTGKKVWGHVNNAANYTWSALKDVNKMMGDAFSGIKTNPTLRNGSKRALKALKNSGMAAFNALRGESDRMWYIKILLTEINNKLDSFKFGEEITEKDVINLLKNSNILFALTELEAEENPDFPIKLLRQIKQAQLYITEIVKNAGYDIEIAEEEVAVN